MRLEWVVTAALAATGSIFAPAMAQDVSSVDANGVKRMVVYGSDPCPRSAADEIVICARRPDHDRYRIPERFRTPDKLTGEHEAWSQRAEALEMQGASGTMSCSPVGPGGATGCMQQLMDQARAERRAKASEERRQP